ncbi:MAG: ABC transporter ATP-binding protein [Anaerolineae bacterium]
MIQVEGLTKYYGNYKAIDRISFFADVGEVVGFVGRNGAGKTTTIRILTGYMPPNEGSVTVAGYDVLEQPIDMRQKLGYLPETVPLYREMTVWQYVEYFASLRGLSGADRERRVEIALEKVNMLERENSMITSISKGMRQRVGLAQAIVHDPEVLILDEPMIGLDPDQRAEMRAIIDEIGEDRTVFLSSHDLAELEKVADRVLMIHKGQIVAEDTPDALATRLEGERRFFLRLGNADLQTAADLITQIEGVLTAVVKDDGIEVAHPQDLDVRPIVATTVVGNEWELLELIPLGTSREDVFLRLTGEDAETR